MVELTDEQYEAAVRRGREIKADVLARSVRYDPQQRVMHVDLRNGASFSFPVDEVQDLSGADDRDLAEVEISGSGYGLHWEKLDADFSVGGLKAGIFGTAKYMALKAERAKLEAEAAASHGDVAGGGRPHKAAG